MTSGIRSGDSAPRAVRGKRRLRAVGVLAALLVSVGAGAAYAAFVATTANSGNSIAAAASFGRCLVDEVMADSPVAYWRLNETSGTSMADSAGSNNGSYVNGVALNQSGALADPVSKAARFDGVDDRASVPDSSSLDVGDTFTYEVWVKRATTNEDTTLVSKGTNAGGDLWFGIEPDNTLGYWNGGTQLAVSDVKITDSKWHHVAATKSGATRNLYLDGLDVTVPLNTSTFVNNSEPLYLGHHVAYPASDLNGSLDEVAVYGTALSQARIRAHYNSGRCYRDEPRADGAQAQWRLGEPAGSRTFFDSLNANAGAALGGGLSFAQTGALDGDANTAASFNGTDDYLDLGDRFDFAGTSSFTAEAWINRGTANEAGGLRRIFDKVNAVSPTDGWRVSIVPASDAANAQKIRFERRGSAQSSVDSATRTVAGRWYHVAVSYNGASMSVYVNGVLESSTASSASIGDTANPLRLAWGPQAGSAEHYGGTIDEAAIYNTALSATRIADHYIAGRSYRDVVGDDDPVSYWRLGETAGTAAADRQAANAGTYVGSPALDRTGAPAGDADRSPLFSGATQYVNVPDSASLDTLGNAGITLEIWAKRSSATGAGSDLNLFSKGCNAAELTLTAASGEVRFYKSCSGGAPLATSTAAANIDDTEWHHIVATKAGTTSKLYVDGVDVTVIGTDSTLAATNVALRISAYDSGGGLFDFFPGRLDEAAVYSRALTATEVNLHYNAGKDSPR